MIARHLPLLLSLTISPTACDSSPRQGADLASSDRAVDSARVDAGVVDAVQRDGAVKICFTASGGFAGQAMAVQKGRFEIVWDATPAADKIDASVVLTGSSAATLDWTDFATLVRFNSTGTVDVRRGGAFASSVTVPYSGGKTYRVRAVVDVPGHRYTVHIQPSGAAEQLLADGFELRTEQQGVTSLDRWGVMSNTGSLKACLISVTPAPTPPPQIVVIYYNSFEQDTPGSDSYKKDWTSCQVNPDAAIYQDPTDANPTKVFRARFPKGTWSLSDKVGFRCIYDFPQGVDEVYLSYRVKFGPGFDAVLGGKLPRVEAGHGGTAGQCPTGSDSFTGGMMFKKDVDPFPVFYIYHPEQWNSPYYREYYFNLTGAYPTSCQDFFTNPTALAELGGVVGTTLPWRRPTYSCAWNAAASCFTGAPATITPGQWHTVTERIVANTVGQHDGLAEGYIDGQMVSQVKDLRYRDVASLKLNWIDFVGFFGGGSAAWATTKDEQIDFDDVIAFTFTATSGQPVGNKLRSPTTPLPSIAYPAQSVLTGTP
jgi:hypothetical protein